MAQDDESPPPKDGPVYFQGFVDVGYSSAMSERNASALRLNFLFGAGFNDWLFIGAGPAMRMSRGLRTFPLFADIRIGNLTRKYAFFFAAGGGVTVGSKFGLEYNGPAGHAEIGLRVNNARKGGFIISFGFETYSAYITQEVNSIYISDLYRYSLRDIQAVTMGIGFSF